MIGVVSQLHVDNRRWDVYVQEADVDPETLAKAA